MIKNCKYCNKEYKRRGTTGVYCSKDCYYESMRGEKRIEMRKRVTKECEVCGDDFIVRECHDHVRTCSRKCGYELLRGQKRKLVERLVKNCINCGEEFRVLPSYSEKKFCKMRCYLDFKSKDVKYPDKQRFQGSSWQKKREEVIERDSGKCQLCGNNGKEVHHKVPYSLTGDDSVDNLILLCKSCHLHIHNIIRSSKESDYKPTYREDEEGAILFIELDGEPPSLEEVMGMVDF